MPTSPRTDDAQPFGRRRVGAGRCPALWLFLPLCLRRVTFVSSDKSNQKRHLRGEGFRFPSPLKNLLSLKRPKREGCGPPSLETPSGGVGDYQIAPLPRSGKGRWRPLAAGGIKKGDGFPRQSADWLGMTGREQGMGTVNGCRGRTASRRRGMRLYNGAQTLGSPFGRAVTAGD